MIENFAIPIDFPIPEILQKDVLKIIHGYHLEKLELSFPMYATGFALLIHVGGDVPFMIKDGISNQSVSKFNLAGQIYETEITMSFQQQEFEALGFILHPMTPYYLFHQKADYFLNQWIPIEEIPDIRIPEGIFQLSKEMNLTERISEVLIFLEGLQKESANTVDWMDLVIQKILQTSGLVDIKDLCEISGMSSRHFRRKFQEYIGMPPKYYCKIIQINSVFQIIKSRQTEVLTQIALDCGYYDQSHFINDFKKHIGLSPRNFLNSEHAFISSYLGVG